MRYQLGIGTERDWKMERLERWRELSSIVYREIRLYEDIEIKKGQDIETLREIFTRVLLIYEIRSTARVVE